MSEQSSFAAHEVFEQIDKIPLGNVGNIDRDRGNLNNLISFFLATKYARQKASLYTPS